MRAWIGLALATAVLWASGCGPCAGGSGFDGTWRGTVSDRGKATLVEIELRGDGTGGTFSVLSETGQDVDKGAVLPIVRAKRDGNRIEFVVPISNGEVDDDAIVFALELDGDELRGTGHEMREGSRRLPVSFTRQR